LTLTKVASAMTDSAQSASGTAIAAKESADAAKKTVETMQRFERINQRAWLSIKDISYVERPFAGGHRLQVDVGVTNTGRTPAKNANLGLNVEAVEKNREPAFNFPDPTGSSAVIFPNGDYGNSGLFNLSRDNWQHVLNGELRVWAYGKVIYNDIFGLHHWIRYCYVFDPRNLFALHGQHNEIDDNE